MSGNMEHCSGGEAHALRRLEPVSGPGYFPQIYSEGQREIQLLKSTFLCLCVFGWLEERNNAHSDLRLFIFTLHCLQASKPSAAFSV